MVGKPHFEVIAQLRHRAHGGAGGFHGVALLDGDGRADIFDTLHAGAVEHVHELPRVGAESLHVAALALGMKGLEDERRFARAAQAGDHDQLPEGQIEIETLEVVLPHAAQADGGKLGRGFGLGAHKREGCSSNSPHGASGAGISGCCGVRWAMVAISPAIKSLWKRYPLP